MNTAKVKVSIGLSLALYGLTGLLVFRAFSQAKETKQPIAFSHKKHSENNIDCIVCHPLYRRAAKAGIPGAEVCRKCHEDLLYVSTEKEKLLQYVKSQVEIPWHQVYEVPSHVLFSHQRHVVAGKLECFNCHGDVTQMTAPLVDPAMNLTMNDCIVCHKTVYKNPYECLACHR